MWAQGLLDWLNMGFNKHCNISWSDEKNFVLQLHHNRRNDRILVPVAAHDPELRLVKRRKQPQSVMVFGAVASNGLVMDPVIIPSGITVNSTTYRDLIPTKVNAWMEQEFGLSGFRGLPGVGRAVLKQDGAPVHTCNSTKGWLRDNLGKDNFWAKQAWQPSKS